MHEMKAWSMSLMQIVALSESDSQKHKYKFATKVLLVVKSYAFDCKLLCLVIMTVSHQPRDRFCIRQCETYFAVNNEDIPHRTDHPAGMGHSVPLVSHWSPSRWRSLRFHFLIWNETHTATKFMVNFNLLTSPGCKLDISKKKKSN